MKEQIQAVLVRELTKLDRRSQASDDPLPSRDVKSLDVLIRAYRAFVDPTKTPPTGSDEPGPVLPATETLVSDVLSDESSD